MWYFPSANSCVSSPSESTQFSFLLSFPALSPHRLFPRYPTICFPPSTLPDMIPTRFTSHESPLKKRVGRRNLAHTTGLNPESSSSGLCLITGTAEETDPVKDRSNLAGATSDEDLVSTNPYITFVTKRIRKLRKRVVTKLPPMILLVDMRLFTCSVL